MHEPQKHYAKRKKPNAKGYDTERLHLYEIQEKTKL